MVVRTDRASMIGITAHWKCAVCNVRAVTHQLVNAADPSLDLPPGWRQRKGLVYCPDFAERGENGPLTLKEIP
jgi:hypothetical protein